MGWEIVRTRSEKQPKQKIEFSKKLFCAVSIITVSVVSFSCVMMWRTNDLSPLMYLIPSVFAELATATGFYYKKAETENRIKLERIYEQEDFE